MRIPAGGQGGYVHDYGGSKPHRARTTFATRQLLRVQEAFDIQAPVLSLIIVAVYILLSLNRRSRRNCCVPASRGRQPTGSA